MSAIAPVKSLVFIDAAVDDYQSLIDGLVPGTEAIVLDPAQDGVEQITATLANRNDIQSVHIVSHGSSGSLQLGTTTLNGESIDRYQAQLQGWRSALTENADILLYGCDVAGDEPGQAFVQHLSQMTEADLAASIDLTGSEALGGDWELEFTTGNIQAADPFQVGVKEAYCHTLATFDVTNTNDNGLGSLRQALLDANADAASAELITFSGAVFTGGTAATITLTSGELTINGNVTIQGNGSEGLIISGNNASRVFNITGGNVTINSLTVTNGRNGSIGAGILQSGGTTRINNSAIQNNNLTGGLVGGGVGVTGGILTIASSTISNNIGGGQGGGGIWNASSTTLTLLNSTISNNSASNTSYGGGGLITSGTATIANSTISGNRSNLDGGGIYAEMGTLTIINSTITNNTADFDNNNSGTGGGIFRQSGTINVRNTIIAGNFDTPGNAGAGSTARNVSGAFVDGGNNLIGTADGSTGFTVGTLVGTNASPIDPLLGVLANNGGITQTHALKAGSLAINAGNNANQPLDLTDIDGDGNTSEFIPVDQRGFLRALKIVDIGAFESDVPVNDAPVLTGTATVTAINEDVLDAANTGTKVSALINGLITDIDGDPKAIAITGVDNTKGVWQYSTDGGTIWTNFSATTSDSTATVLGATSFYQANLGTAPIAQGQLSFTNLNPSTPAQLGTQTFGSSGAILNTDVDSNIYAGYSNFSGATPVNPPLPKLDNVAGYSVSFNLQLLTESHTNPDRAGFSLIVVSSDKTKAIELGFQDGNIFAQKDAGFTAGENAIFNTKQSIDYRLEVLGNSYTLFANSASILTGALRDYAAFNGAPDPYETPNFIFLGDDSTSAKGSFNLSQVVVQTDNRVRFVPSANANGNSTINFRAWDTTDGVSAGAIVNASVNGSSASYSSASKTATITVTPVNDTPTALDDTVTVLEDSTTSINVLSNDSFAPDTAETLSISAVGATSSGGTATINGSSINYTPAANFNGTDTFTYTLSDGNGGTATATATITVTAVNDAPTALDDTATVLEDSTSSSINVLSNDSFAPDTAETLSISVVGATSSGGTATINGSSINYTPAANFNGTDTFSYTLSDGNGGTDIAIVSVAVLPVNDAPTISGTSAITIAEDSLYSFTPTAVDVDLGTTLTFSITNQPTWATFASATGQLSGTPVNANVGTTTGIIISVSDGTATTALSAFNLAVTNINDIPTVTTAIANQSATENTLFTFAVPANTFTDIDAGDTLTYTVIQSDNTPLPTWLTFNATTQTFSGTPTNADIGTLDIKVTAKDTTNATAEDIFILTVANFNDAPTVATAIADQPAIEDTLFTFAVPTNTFTDVDTNDVLTYTATQADNTPLPSWLTFNATNQTFSGTPLNAQVGSLSVKVKATDTDLLTAEDIFKIDVANTNDAPTVTNAIADQTLTQDAPFTFTLPTNTFTDVDAGDTLTYTATLANSSPLPTWLTFNSTTRTFSGTPRNANVGSLDLKVKATDKAGATAEDGFIVKVTNINRSPVIGTPITPTPQQVTATQPFTLKIPTGAFTDPDAGDTLTFSASLENGAPLPPWLVFDAKTGAFSGSPDIFSVGNLSLKVNATDAQGLKTSQLVKLAIANPTGITGIPTALIDFSNSKKGITRKAKKGQLLRGTNRSDILKGTKGSDRINSGGRRDSRSKDKLYGFNGNDRLKAGGGNDYADGGRGNDFLQGGKGRDLLQGSDGIDRLLGGKGDDLLIGGNGGDTLIGGKGRDMFVFANANEGKDAIADFTPSEDVIDLRSLFSQPQFAGATSYVRYLKYVQLTQVGASTEIKVDADGSRVGSTFTTLATLNNLGIGAVSSRNFVIS